jgi:hypothetical protein
LEVCGAEMAMYFFIFGMLPTTFHPIILKINLLSIFFMFKKYFTKKKQIIIYSAKIVDLRIKNFN